MKLTMYTEKTILFATKKAKISKYCNLFPNGECVMKNLKMCDVYY